MDNKHGLNKLSVPIYSEHHLLSIACSLTIPLLPFSAQWEEYMTRFCHLRSVQQFIFRDNGTKEPTSKSI